MPPSDGGGGGGGEAYRRALLKKLRAAVAAKTRVDAGDPSLQPAQVEKGRKASVDDALRALKREGLGRGDELVKLALARGVALWYGHGMRFQPDRRLKLPVSAWGRGTGGAA